MQPAHMIDDGIGAIWLNEVNCTGAESTLLQCAYNADSLHCSHHEDVGIHCFLSCSTKDEGGILVKYFKLSYIHTCIYITLSPRYEFKLPLDFY